jgi:hypothetical protein
MTADNHINRFHYGSIRVRTERSKKDNRYREHKERGKNAHTRYRSQQSHKVRCRGCHLTTSASTVSLVVPAMSLTIDLSVPAEDKGQWRLDR